MLTRSGRGRGAAKTKAVSTGAVRQGKKPVIRTSASKNTAASNPSKRSTKAKKSLEVPDDNSDGYDGGDDLPNDKEHELVPSEPRPVPEDVIRDRFCLFCWNQQAVRVHHSIPTAAEIMELEKNLHSVKRELRNAESKLESHVDQDSDDCQDSLPLPLGGPVKQSRTSNTKSVEDISARYNALSYQLQRAEELHKKGFGAPFDLWIDHLTLTQILRDGWHYTSLRQKLPEEWIQDPEIPEFLQDKRPRFPRGTYQQLDIEEEAAAPNDEEFQDDLDDYDQRATIDMHRLRNASPMPGLADDKDYDEGGDNMTREAAVAAINKLRAEQIPELIKMWHDNAKPFTHRDSKLQMKDYVKDVHTFMEPRSDHKPSLESYRAITNIAFSMYSAHRLWKKHGLTDEGYSKLLKDAFQQLGSLRTSLDEAGVKGLPPLLDLPPPRKPRQREALEPFVIDHWMDSKEAQAKQVYTYKPDRPLGPMISENLHASHAGVPDGNSSAGFAMTEDGFVDFEKYSGRSSKVKMSREELAGLNMEMDQLVESD